jgi:hypothetical protein
LLDEITFIKKGPTIVTQASLMTKITESPDSSIYLISEEFSDLIMKSGEDMFQFLTSLFDGKKSIEAATISRGVEFASKPCVNMIAATTPQWVAAHMPENIIGGGFASRVIFIQEDRVRHRKMYYKEVNAATNFDGMKIDLLADLAHIAESLSGDFEIDEEAMEFMEAWYQENAEGEINNYKLSGYYQRRPAHIHKVAMLLHIAKSDELVIHKEDFLNAIDIVARIEKNLPKVFEGVGKNPYTFDIARIKNHIFAAEPVSHADLMMAFQSAAEPWRLEQLVNSLVVRDEVIKLENDGTTFYASPTFRISTTINGRKPFDPNDIDTWNN